jgi:methyl-accepting chemotaxis protein
MLAKTTLGMVVVGLVPLVLFGLVTLWQQDARLQSDAEKSMQQNAERVSAQVDEWIDKNTRVLRTAASLDAISTMSAAEQTKVLSAIPRSCPWIYLAFTVGLDGKNVARSDSEPLTNYSDRKYITEIVNRGQDLSWETLIGKTSGRPALVLAVPIRANGVIVGALAAAMTIEDISGIVATWKAGSTGYAFLLDETSKVVAHPRSQLAQTQRRLADHPLISAYRADLSPPRIRYSYEGVDVLGAVHRNRMNWAVVVQQNTAELFAPLRQTLYLGVGLLAGAILLVGIFAFIFSRMLVKPIVAMTNAADEMSLGNLETPIATDRGDEIGLLAQALERLRKSMLMAMSRLVP